MDTNIEHIFDQNGVDRVAFYYRSTPILNNAFTTCLFINSEKKRIEARGVSICSVKDVYCKKAGKNRAFGRAMKALVRKENDGRINPLGRDLETIRREIKCKTLEDDTQFHNKIPEILSVDPNIDILVADGDGKCISKYAFQLPLSYPIKIANQTYRYKSQYRPNPAGQEEALLLKERSASIMKVEAPAEAA
jgi:hypothetical protein